MLSEAPVHEEWTVENWRNAQKERKARMGMPGPSLSLEEKRNVRDRIDTLNDRWRQHHCIPNPAPSIDTLDELSRPVAGARLTTSAIFRVVSRHTGAPLEEMLGRYRKRHPSYARKLATYLTRKHTKRSFTVIAKALHRDHTTIQYSVRSIRDLIEAGNASVIADVEAVERRLGVLS